MSGICYFACCCCCVLPVVGFSIYAVSNYIFKDAELFSVILSTFTMAFKVYCYFWMLGLLCTIIGYIFYYIHQLGLSIISLREQNKYMYKPEELQSNFRHILKVIVSNLIFICSLYYFGAYVQYSYFNYLIILYVALIFGYVACYPLTEEETSSLLNNSRSIQKQIYAKTFINTLTFFAMFSLGYYNY